MPRKYGVSEWTVSVADLQKFVEDARIKVKLAKDILDNKVLLRDEHYNPGEKQCRWCRAKAKCKPYDDYVKNRVLQEFDNLEEVDDDWLSQSYEMIPMVRAWINAIKDEAYRRLTDGEKLKNYKLVKGKSSGRKWENEEDAAEKIRKMRIKQDDAFTIKLKSPPQLEENIAGKHPGKWTKLQTLIYKPEGKPTIAPITDPRPCISEEILNEFENLDNKE